MPKKLVGLAAWRVESLPCPAPASAPLPHTGGAHLIACRDQNKATFQCQSTSMPYPYNTIVDPLDVAAQSGRGQLGDSEPEELKKYDKNDKQK